MKKSSKLEIRFFRGWPVGVCAQIANRALYFGLITACTSAMTGPMFLLDNPSTKSWERINFDLNEVWKGATDATKVLRRKSAGRAPHGEAP